jgi:hypothetical protein
MNPTTRIAIVNRLKKLEEWKRIAECALESADETMDRENIGCDCGTDEPGTCAVCLVQNAIKTMPKSTCGI